MSEGKLIFINPLLYNDLYVRPSCAIPPKNIFLEKASLSFKKHPLPDSAIVDSVMTFFDQINGKDAPRLEEAEVKLDLCGMEKKDALQKLDHVVKYCKKSSAASLYVCFDPAKPGAGETLFQPVARYFKIEKFNGYIEQALPVMTEKSGGLFIRFKI